MIPPRRRPLRRRALVPLLALAVVSGCPAREVPADAPSTATSSAARETTAPVTPPWYRRARALDLTSDGVPDTVRLEAHGRDPDSLQLTLALVVGGRTLHEERWGSSYELALVDSARRATAGVDAVLRARLDSVLAEVRVQPLAASRIMEEDRAILATLQPVPAARISVAYGYETTVHLVWDAPRRRFVRLWSCC